MMDHLSMETTAGALHASLKSVARIIARRNTIPILSAVMFKGDTVTANNLDIEIMCAIAARKSNGGAVIEAAPLQRLLAALPAAMDITLSSGETGARLAYDHGECELPVFRADDYPDLTMGDMVNKWSGPDRLHEAIGTALPFVSREETRYYLNGVHLHSDSDGQVIAVATDGHRLMRAPTGQKHVIHPDENIILPTMAAGLLADAPLTAMWIGNGKILARRGGMAITAKLIDGSFPDYNRVIPQGRPSASMSLDRAHLDGALGRLAAIADNRSTVNLAFTGDEAAIAAHGRDEGKRAREVMPLVSARGKPWDADICVNGRYLQDVLRSWRGEPTVTMNYFGDGEPMRFHASAADPATGRIAVLMPMRGSATNFLRTAFDALRTPAREAA